MAIGGRSWRSSCGQAVTETMIMMMFLIVLIAGLGVFSMLVATKQMLDYSAFAAGRSVLVGGDYQAAAKQVMDASLRWAGATVPQVTGNPCEDTPSGSGMTRNGLMVSMKVKFGWPIFTASEADDGIELKSPVACTPQDDFDEQGDNTE